MILTNDFLQEKIYKERLHLGKDEFYSGLSHAMLNEKNVMQRTGIRSCNDESKFLFKLQFFTIFLEFAMIWTLCENEINFMCQNEYSEGVNGEF